MIPVWATFAAAGLLLFLGACAMAAWMLARPRRFFRPARIQPGRLWAVVLLAGTLAVVAPVISIYLQEGYVRGMETVVISFGLILVLTMGVRMHVFALQNPQEVPA